MTTLTKGSLKVRAFALLFQGVYKKVYELPQTNQN
jgi:hypothetical protein